MEFNHNVTTEKLPTGNTFIGIEMPYAPYSIVGVSFPAGSRFDPHGKEGLAHLFEHFFMARTRTYPDQQKRLSYLEGHGIDFNAATNKEIAYYTHTQLVGYMEDSLSLLFDGLCNTIITNEDLKREKEAVLNERIRRLQDPQILLLRAGQSALWPKARLAHDIMGTEKTIKRIVRADIAAFEQQWYQAARRTFVAVGSQNEVAQAREFIRARLAKIQEAPCDIVTEDNIGGIVNISFVPEIARTAHEHALVGLYVKTGGYQSVDDRVALSFIRNYLANTWISLFVQELRVRRGATYWVEGSSEFFSDTGYMEFICSVHLNKVLEVTEYLLQELLQLKKEGLTQDMLQPHKMSLLASIAKTAADPAALYNWYVDEPTMGAEILSFEMFTTAIEQLTLERIRETAQKYFTLDNLAVVIGTSKNPQLISVIEKTLES